MEINESMEEKSIFIMINVIRITDVAIFDRFEVGFFKKNLEYFHRDGLNNLTQPNTAVSFTRLRR